MIFRRKTESVDIVCDVSPRSIGFALVKKDNSEKKEILYSRRVHIPMEETGEQIENVDFSISTVLEDVNKNALKNFKNDAVLSRFFCVLNSPWYVSQSRKVIFEQKEDFTVSKKLVDDLTEAEEKKFKGELITQKDVKKNFKEGVQLLERKLTNFHINGYETKNPFQKTAKKIEFNMYISATPFFAYETIKKRVAKFLHMDEVIFTTYPLALLNATKKMFANEDNFLVIHISPQSTDISLVSNSSIISTSAFETGYENLIEQIRLKFGIPYNVAYSLFSLYASNLTDNATSEIIKSLISRDLEKWGKEIKAKLDELSLEPKKKIFLVSESEVLPVLKDQAQKALEEISPNIFFLRKDRVKEKFLMKGEVYFDPNLFIGILGAESN